MCLPARELPASCITAVAMDTGHCAAVDGVHHHITGGGFSTTLWGRAYIGDAMTEAQRGSMLLPLLQVGLGR